MLRFCRNTAYACLNRQYEGWCCGSAASVCTGNLVIFSNSVCPFITCCRYGLCVFIAAKRSCSPACHTLCGWMPSSLVSCCCCCHGCCRCCCAVYINFEPALQSLRQPTVVCAVHGCSVSFFGFQSTDLHFSGQPHVLHAACAHHICFTEQSAVCTCPAGGLVIVFNKQQAYLLGEQLLVAGSAHTCSLVCACKQIAAF